MKTLPVKKNSSTQRRTSLGVCLVVVPVGVVTVYMRLRGKSAVGDILPPPPPLPFPAPAPFLSLLGRLLLPFAAPCSLPPASAPVDQPPLIPSPPVSMIHA